MGRFGLNEEKELLHHLKTFQDLRKEGRRHKIKSTGGSGNDRQKKISKKAFLQVFHLIADLNRLYLDHEVRLRFRGFYLMIHPMHQMLLVMLVQDLKHNQIQSYFD